MAGDVEELRQRLRAVADELADLAIERLRQAVDHDGEPGVAAATATAHERRLTRARRAVEKAIAVLGEPDQR